MTRRTLSPQQARSLARDWQGGPQSPLRALAQSGTVLSLSKLLAEVAANQMAAGSLDDARDLRRLFNWIEMDLEHHPADPYPWRAPWADTNMENQADD